MTLRIVDSLQAIDIDERDDESAIAFPSGALDLVGELFQAHAPPPCARQLIEARAVPVRPGGFPVAPCPSPVFLGVSAIATGVLPIGDRVVAVALCMQPIGDGSPAIVAGVFPVVDRMRAVAFGVATVTVGVLAICVGAASVVRCAASIRPAAISHLLDVRGLSVGQVVLCVAMGRVLVVAVGDLVAQGGRKVSSCRGFVPLRRGVVS